VLVGSKYDLFEKYETENRKWLSRALRYLAHTHNCSLVLSAKNNAALGSQIRGFLTEVPITVC
jgi:dynein light intermediate chain 2